MNFTIMEALIPFEWSRMDVIVINITFNQLMIKLRHADNSWIDGFAKEPNGINV